MTDEPLDDEAVAAAFAEMKAAAAAQFPPPPVHEMLMRGPAALRRRRLVSLAAVLGACTAVTAGGFAVAQTLGPLTGGINPAGPGSANVGSSASDDEPSSWPGETTTPEGEPGETVTTTPAAPADHIEALWVNGPLEGDWAASCATGPQEADFTAWEITADSGWSISAVAEGDADGDGTNDTVLALTCAGRTGVAAFSMQHGDTGPVLASFGWVWQPAGADDLVAIDLVEDGGVALEGTDGAAAPWADRYEWDGEEFVHVDEPEADEPSPTETSASPTPSETPTATDGAAASSSSGS
ncbi:hypothetical protein [Glycomyces sp. NRRL B-16210]|uniref:hypothetical protein n=1 Tax=Glycomyces sp. NRRL B-16210 TaxID=1463821 RepID=UPI0004C1F0F3|nr:hypothetical protein [Glycomyces sp. NRRL B-16210]